MAREVGSSHWFPKVIVPRQISETFKPVRPKRLIFIFFSSLSELRDAAREYIVPGIGTIHGFWVSSQASAICAGIAFFRFPILLGTFFLHDQAWYCSSLTFSIQSAVLPSRRS